MKVGERMGHAWGGPGKYLGTCLYDGEKCVMVLARYAEDGVAVLLQSSSTGEPWARLSVALSHVRLEAWEFVVNHDCMEHTNEVLRSSGGALEDTGRRVAYGFVRQAPVWRLGASVVGALLADALQGA